MVVNNIFWICHLRRQVQPALDFNKRRLTVADRVAKWTYPVVTLSPMIHPAVSL